MRINTYGTDSNLQPEDFLLGTKGGTLLTKNFLLSEIAEFTGKYLMETASESEAVFSNFVFGYTATGQVVKIPITDFTGALVGNLQGDYSEFTPEEGDEENYL